MKEKLYLMPTLPERYNESDVLATTMRELADGAGAGQDLHEALQSRLGDIFHGLESEVVYAVSPDELPTRFDGDSMGPVLVRYAGVYSSSTRLPSEYMAADISLIEDEVRHLALFDVADVSSAKAIASNGGLGLLDHDSTIAHMAVDLDQPLFLRPLDEIVRTYTSEVVPALWLVD